MQISTAPTWDVNAGSSYPKLAENIRADVVIIGGGLAGVMSAYLLSRAGKKVVLLEQGTLGSGATGYTTAFITQAIDSGLRDLVSMLGPDNARLVWQSGADALSELRHIVEREAIDCELTSCPAYIFAHTESQSDRLAAEAAAVHSLGFAAAHARDDALGFTNAGYMTIPDQAKFHPLKFLRAVAVKAAGAGARIFEDTTAVELSESGPVKVVTADGYSIQADDVIVATYVPFNKPKQNRFKKAVYRSYVLELSVPRAALREGIYWDQSNPYTYFRIDHDGNSDCMIIGGADHRADIPFSREKNYQVLEHSAKNLLGGAPYTIARRWDGDIIESVDGLPFIGAYEPHRYLATAFSGNGMTYSVIAGMLLRDVLTGRDNPWVNLYNPLRKPKIGSLVKKGIHYMLELLGGIRNSF